MLPEPYEVARLTSFEERFGSALRRWDPLEGAPLMNWLDPVGSRGVGTGEPEIRPLRVAALAFFVGGPPLLLSLLPSRTAGGGFGGINGMNRDVFVLFFYWICLPALTLLLLYGRRLLGDMINRLEAAFNIRIQLDKLIQARHVILRFFEWVSRPTKSRVCVFVGIALLMAAFNYLEQLRFGHWLVSPAQQGTFFYPLRLGSNQPNLAGLYANLMGFIVPTLLYLLLARLIVEFALVCAYLGEALRGRLMPAHPDRLGGLRPLGWVALVLSAPVFVIGLAMTVVTLTEVLVWRRPQVATTVYAQWVLYALLCPLLFVLPVLPLHRLMDSSKNAFLLRLEEAYGTLDSSTHVSTVAGKVVSERTQEQFAIAQLIERAEQMSIWPFDRTTFMRFVGLVLGPVIPLLGPEPGELLRRLLKSLFGVGA